MYTTNVLSGNPTLGLSKSTKNIGTKVPTSLAKLTYTENNMASDRRYVQDEYTNKYKIPMITRELAIIPLWLRDTYALIHSEPVNDLQGPLNESIFTEELAQQSLQGEGDQHLFLSGGDIFTYLSRNQSKLCDQTITIVIHSLRDLYWNIRQTLPKEEISRLEIALKQPLPRFKNIFEYRKIESVRDLYPSPLYQMFGTLTPFSVIHLPVRHFIESMNARLPLRIVLSDTEVMIQLDTEAYDFWDPVSQSLIKEIRC